MAVQITVPLTSVFTPPASCSSHWTYQGSSYNGVSEGILLQNAVGATLDYSCFPTRFEQDGRAHHGTYIYSPGYCPAGYSTASQTVDSITTAVCCPSNYNFLAFNGTATSGATRTVLLEGCTSVFSTGSTTTVLGVSGDGTLRTTTVSGSLTMWAQPISVAFTQADLALFTGAATAAASSSATIASQTGSATSSPTATSGPSSGLPGGAIAGIVIGAIAGVALLVGALVFLYRRRAPKHAAASKPNFNAEPKSATSEYSFFRPVADGVPVQHNDTEQRAYELSTDPRITGQTLEMPSDPRATGHRVELPADPRITGERVEVDGSAPGQAY